MKIEAVIKEQNGLIALLVDHSVRPPFQIFGEDALDTNSIFRSPFCRMVTPKKRRTVAAVNCVPNHSYLYDTSFLFTGSRIFSSIISSRRFLSLVGLRG